MTDKPSEISATSATPPASIRDTLRLLESIRNSGSREVIVAFSGGKDSIACLHLAHRVFGPGRIHVYNLYVVPELECEMREIRKAEHRYGLKIRRLPHPGVAKSLRAGHLQPTPTDFNRDLQHSDIYLVVRDLTGADWIIFGHRMDESLQRRGMIKATQGIDTEHKKCWPLWNWKKHDVYRFLTSAKIPLPEQWTEDDTTGFTLGPHTLLYLRKKFPEDYKKVIALFPFAEVQLLREQARIAAGLPPTVHSIAATKNKPGLIRELLEFRPLNRDL